MIPNTEWERDWVRDHQPPKAKFSLAVIPDTQELAAQYRDKLAAIMQWIADHKEEENIRFAADMGDVSWNGHLKNDLGHGEYAAAVKARDILLEAGVEYSLCYGNHDYTPREGGVRDTELLNTYFAKIRDFASLGGVKETGKVDNTYFTFEADNKDFLLLSLECCPDEDTIRWADEVVGAHPRHNAIVATHVYLDIDGTKTAYAEELWEKLVKKHRNIFLVLSGHMENHRDPGSMAFRQDTGDHGNTVYQIMANAQDVDVARGGVGILLMVRFTEDGRLDFHYFSPFHNGWAFKACNQFSVTLPEGLLMERAL